MKRLKPILMKIAQTENIRMGISADESYNAIEGFCKAHEYNIDNFYILRSIGLWGCYARQELDRSIENPITYSIEVYQLNKGKNADRTTPDKLCIILIWHYDEYGKRNLIPQFMTRKDKSAHNVRDEFLSGIVTIPSGHKIVMLPNATTWEEANKQTLAELKKIKERN